MDLLGIIQDGRDAYQYGYAITRCPYIVSTLDLAGVRHGVPRGFEAMRQLWETGWRAAELQAYAAATLFCLDSPLEGDVRPMMQPTIDGLRAALLRGE